MSDFLAESDFLVEGTCLVEDSFWAKRALLPAFPRRGGCAIKKKRAASLAGADGAVSKFENKVRFANIYKEAARLFLMLRAIALALPD